MSGLSIAMFILSLRETAVVAAVARPRKLRHGYFYTPACFKVIR